MKSNTAETKVNLPSASGERGGDAPCIPTINMVTRSRGGKNKPTATSPKPAKKKPTKKKATKKKAISKVPSAKKKKAPTSCKNKKAPAAPLTLPFVTAASAAVMKDVGRAVFEEIQAEGKTVDQKKAAVAPIPPLP